MVEALRQANPAYRNIVIETIEEEEEEAKTKGYDYWYVPTYFVDDVKMMEGVPTLQAVEAVLKEALANK